MHALAHAHTLAERRPVSCRALRRARASSWHSNLSKVAPRAACRDHGLQRVAYVFALPPFRQQRIRMHAQRTEIIIVPPRMGLRLLSVTVWGKGAVPQ